MARRILYCAALSVLGLGGPIAAAPVADVTRTTGGGGGLQLPPYLQCVPYARQVSGIRIYGDAHTWWKQAEGHYARGYRPRVGAVMALKPHNNSRLGHVAAVSRIVDSRTILVRHANWSLINGRRGQIEDNVRVVDVSAANDWSAVRVWNAPIQALGPTHWPVQGFIYNGRPSGAEPTRPAAAPVRVATSRPASTRSAASRTAVRSTAATRAPGDPIANLLASRMGW